MSPLGAERDPVRHSDTRRKLAHSFSESALTQQAPIIMSHVDLFMAQLAKHGQGKDGVKIDEVSDHMYPLNATSSDTDPSGLIG